MNIARLFSYTLLLETELGRERAAHERTRREAKEDREALTDAFARARGATSVYAPLPPPEHPLIGKPAVGPTMVAARAQAQKLQQERNKRQPTEEEIAAAIVEALDEQESRPNGDAEPPEPISPSRI